MGGCAQLDAAMRKCLIDAALAAQQQRAADAAAGATALAGG